MTPAQRAAAVYRATVRECEARRLSPADALFLCNASLGRRAQTATEAAQLRGRIEGFASYVLATGLGPMTRPDA